MARKEVSGVWQNITKINDELCSLGFSYSSFFETKIGNDEKTMFWKDKWIGDSCLQTRFPALYANEKRKRCRVRDRIGPHGFIWDWANEINHGSILVEFCDLLQGIMGIGLNGLRSTPDKLMCLADVNGGYQVSQIRCILDERITCAAGEVMKWSNMAPLKINCFIWRARLGRIPVVKNLLERGVYINSTECSVCNNTIEDVNHALIECPRAIEVRNWIFRWCGVTMPPITSISQFLDQALVWGRCPKKRIILLTIFQCLLWCIWKARNEKAFNGVHRSYAMIVDEVVTTSFIWVKYRGKVDVDRPSWDCCPLA